MASCFVALCRDESWSYLRSTGCDRQSGGRFHVLRGIEVPVMDRAARGAGPLPDMERFGAVLDAAGGTGLGGRLEPADLHQGAPVPDRLVLQHGHEPCPARVLHA